MTNHPAEWAREKAISLCKGFSIDTGEHDKNICHLCEPIAQALVKQRDDVLEEAVKVCGKCSTTLRDCCHDGCCGADISKAIRQLKSKQEKSK